MKTRFLADWEALKKKIPDLVKDSLAAIAQADAAHQTEVKQGLAVLQKTTGLTPALKKIDEGFAKEHRATVIESAVELNRIRTPISMVLTKLVTRLSQYDMDACQDVRDFKAGLEKIESDVATSAKQLQTAKGGIQQDQNWNLAVLFEGDFKSNVDNLKTKLKANAAADKPHNALKLVTPMMTFMDSFTKAAAHLKAKEAYAALKGFQAAVKEADKKLGDIAAKEKAANKNYADALTSFMGAVKGLNRINDQLRKLEEHMASAG